jgi:4-hydroxy-tetrahydrodipicolinate synthase
MAISGTYPMLYAFYGPDGGLRRDAFARQMSAAVASGADGIAVLGLGTEVFKLSLAERRNVVEWVLAEAGGRLPVAVTIADGNMPDMADAARHAEQAGAAWLILQPPRPPASGADLITFFATVAGATTGGLLLRTLGEDSQAYVTVFAVSSLLRVVTVPLLRRVRMPDRATP